MLFLSVASRTQGKLGLSCPPASSLLNKTPIQKPAALMT